jgi:hypothetical protein
MARAPLTRQDRIVAADVGLVRQPRAIFRRPGFGNGLFGGFGVALCAIKGRLSDRLFCEQFLLSLEIGLRKIKLRGRLFGPSGRLIERGFQLRNVLLRCRQCGLQPVDLELKRLRVDLENDIAFFDQRIRLRDDFRDPAGRREMQDDLDNALEHARVGRRGMVVVHRQQDEECEGGTNRGQNDRDRKTESDQSELGEDEPDQEHVDAEDGRHHGVVLRALSEMRLSIASIRPLSLASSTSIILA